MTQGVSALPDYKRPPVVEVVFAVATSMVSPPLTVVDLAQFGWNLLGEEFPNRQEQPPVMMPTESFNDSVASLAPTVALLSGPPPLRLWFQSENGTRLVQLQRDWIACNWQGGSTSGEYPHYDAIEGMFAQTWDKWTGFVANKRSEAPRPLQCELTYVNHIGVGSTWSGHGEMNKVISLVSEAHGFLPMPEDGQISTRYRISDRGQDAVGRLYVTAAPGVRAGDESPVIQLTLTARGAPLSDGKDGMMKFFKLAHEWIVRGFAAVTTEEAQREWERIQ